MSRAKEFRRLQSEVLEKEGFGKAEIQAIYLGVIADSLAAIADCLERLSDKDGEKIRQCSEALSSGTDPDTISRQAAIDGKICIRRSNGVEIYDDYVVPVEYLEQLPSAQPEPKRGEWKAVRINPRMIRCSNCNSGWWYKELIKALKFCPSCGADMRGTNK